MHFHVLQTKPEKYGLLGPLVHMPVAVFLLFGHAERPAVQRAQRILDRFAGFACGGWRDCVARIPRGLNGGFQLRVGHGPSGFSLLSVGFGL